jgi:hypothetical protein
VTEGEYEDDKEEEQSGKVIDDAGRGTGGK